MIYHDHEGQTTMPNLENRIARLEEEAGPGPDENLVACMEAARVRLRAVPPKLQRAALLEKCRRALTSEPPVDELALRLWQADRRLVRLLCPD